MASIVRTSIALALVLALSVLVPAQDAPSFSVPFRELESYKKSGVLWRNIVVDKKIKREDLIKLAKELHAAFPTTPFRIFTDDKEFQTFMLRDINYPDPAYRYPEEWVKKHHIGIINKMLNGSGPRWQLYPQTLLGMKYVAKGESVIANLD